MKWCCACLLVVGLFIVISCKKDDPNPIASGDIEAYLDSMGLEAIVDNNGLYGIRNTSFPPSQTGDVVTFRYQLSTLDGTELSRTDSNPVLTSTGTHSLFPEGLDEALGYMNPGEQWSFIMIPERAYGLGQQFAQIPPDAIIRFDIELVERSSVDDIRRMENVIIVDYLDDENWYDTANYLGDYPVLLPSGIIYKRMMPGNGTSAQTGRRVTIDYTGTFLDKNIFSSRAEFPFILGENKVIPGLEQAVAIMEEGERARVIIPFEWGYRESAVVVPGVLMRKLIEDQQVPEYASKVGPYRTLVFEIILKAIE